MFPTEIHDDYKKFRNSVAALGREESLRVIWAYCQYLQLDRFQIPHDILVDRRFYQREFERSWINEWTLALFAKEVILHSGALPKKKATLREWNTLANFINRINKLENEIYGAFRSTQDALQSALVELIRIAHRTFEWQGNEPNQRSIIRYHKIFNTPEISDICVKTLGLSAYEILACGTALMGHFIGSHSLRLPATSDLAALPIAKFEALLAFTAESLPALKVRLAGEQRYDEGFAYAFNSLRARPIVYMCSDTSDVAVCPLPTLLFWRITSGLYYDLINVPTFANLFGDSFQAYVGEVGRAAAPSRSLYDEQVYSINGREKRSIDWIVSDGKAALFLECKVKRLRWDTKQTLSDLTPLEEDIGYIASAVVQTYKTIRDCLDAQYPHFKIEPGLKVYPCVITLEDWHIHGPVMYGKIRELVRAKMAEENLPEQFTIDMPYSIWPVEHLEIGLQVMDDHPISDVMDGKLLDPGFKDWEWQPYLGQKFKGTRKSIFDKDYRNLFADIRPI